MNLAVLFLFGVSLSSGGAPIATAIPGPAFGQTNVPAGQDQAASPQPQNPSNAGKSASAASPPPQDQSTPNPPATVKHPRHKRKKIATDCSGDPPPNPNGSPASPQAGPAAANSAPQNCPPTKVIVRQGGTTEPTIQLAGASGGKQVAEQRASTNALLDSAEQTLKKVAGSQLAPDQQDMVKQIGQFMEQSKSAMDSGDLERAYNLAWKAQKLSQELVKAR